MQNARGFGALLKELRNQKGFSQQQLADAVMVSRATIAMYESERRLPDIHLIQRLAHKLSVDSRILLDAIGNGQDEVVNIIVVEDVPTLLRGTVHLIESELPEANIVGFEGSVEALDYARMNRVSVAFLDIELDERMDGLALARHMTELNASMNIIFLTSHIQYIEQAVHDHCSGYISKPINREKLRHELAHLRFPVRGMNG